MQTHIARCLLTLYAAQNVPAARGLYRDNDTVLKRFARRLSLKWRLWG